MRTLALREDRAPSYDAIRDAVARMLAHHESEGLVPVLNGTGIVLHTNLGRAPLAPEALEAIAQIAGGYSNLEFDLESGERGSRYARARNLIRETTGAEDGLVVNNCAAAMLLILQTLAAGREVIVARNQLVEIGGGFRLPDVLERSGATLVEVGTTNRVRLSDYEHAISPRTAMFLRSHASNYRIEGFVEDVAVERACDSRPARRRSGRRRSRQWCARRFARFWSRARADRPRSNSRRLRARGIFRRQAAWWAASGHHRRPQRADRTFARRSVDARAARRQSDARRTRRDAAPVSLAAKRHTRPDLRNARSDAR